MRRAVVAFSAALAAAALAASAPAATVSPGLANRAGTYNGDIWQILPTAPNLYIGHIHFVVSGGKIFDLRFTAQTTCGTMSAIDKDHSLPEFPLALGPTGAFSYSGTVAGRVLRLRGRIIGGRAHGTFFQSFSLSALTCSMGQPAAFTATR
jgi:hypothetical protein